MEVPSFDIATDSAGAAVGPSTARNTRLRRRVAKEAAMHARGGKLDAALARIVQLEGEKQVLRAQIDALLHSGNEYSGRERAVVAGLRLHAAACRATSKDRGRMGR